MLSTSFQLIAQEAEIENKPILENKAYLFLHPQDIIVGGFSIGIARPLDKKRNMLSAIVTLYSNTINGTEDETNFEYSDEMTGAGLRLWHKIYFQQDPNSNFYFGHGLHLQYFNVEGLTEVFVEQDNQTYILDVQEESMGSFRYGYDALIGYSFLVDRFYADFYIGSGIRFVSLSGNENAFIGRNYDQGIFNFTSNGITALLGVKIGFAI